MVRLLIVSDIRLYREGLAAVLEADGRVAIVGVAGSVDEAIAALDGRRPDVVLLDAATPAMLAGACVIKQSLPESKVVALGVPNAEGEVIACAEAGLAGYVFREGSVDDLVATVESAAHGELRCSPRIAGALMRRLGRLATGAPAPEQVRLTPREVEVVQMIADGLTNKEISARLHIEVATVKNHVHNLLEKLGVRRRGEVAAKMRQPLRSPAYRVV